MCNVLCFQKPLFIIEPAKLGAAKVFNTSTCTTIEYSVLTHEIFQNVLRLHDELVGREFTDIPASCDDHKSAFSSDIYAERGKLAMNFNHTKILCTLCQKPATFVYKNVQ